MNTVNTNTVSQVSVEDKQVKILRSPDLSDVLDQCHKYFFEAKLKHIHSNQSSVYYS